MTQGEAQKILVVDDAADNRMMLSDLLTRDHVVTLAKNGEQALARAAEQQPDLILLDVVMPGMDGYEVLRRLQADRRTAAIPVIFITGLNAAEDEIRGLQYGAVDYIAKPFNPVVVQARVAIHLKLARQRRMLEALANIDGLTELPNRRQFDASFDAEWRRAQRDRKPISVAILDVDSFKQYNDRYGHALGDRVLQSVARALASVLKRPADLAARYGGEEFAVLMPDTDAAGAASLAEALRAAVEQLGIAHEGSDAAPHVTISVGVATVGDAAGMSAADILQCADDRLYRAKDTGRNRVVAE